MYPAVPSGLRVTTAPGEQVISSGYQGQRGRPLSVAVPSGTVTFLFTDTEGSTRLWQAAPDAMRQGLERHDAILRATVKPSQVKAAAGEPFS